MEQSDVTLRNPSLVSEDRISGLPEPLILQILSSLPTKDVVATSVLSKRWGSFWKVVPNLEFESYGNMRRFAENVCKCLLSHKAPVLESLHLKLGNRCEDVYVGIWVAIAFNRHVREFLLDLNFYEGEPLRFPNCLFCYDELETLKLKNKVLLDVPSLVPMKSLKTLHLHSVVYKDNASVRNLFSSCPNLEHLVVRRGCFYNNVVEFVIFAPSLKTLLLHVPSSGKENMSYVINAPSLEYLNLDELEGYELCLSENAFESLVEANIRNVTCLANEMAMGSLKSVKRLSLDLTSLQIAFPIGVVFDHLVYLEMYSHKMEWWNLLALMLDSSPKLRALKLIGDSLSHKQPWDYNKKNKDQGKWNEPEHVPECLLFNLETLVWVRHDWVREEEKEVAIYILENAKQLKKATFTAYPIEAKMHYKLARRREMLSELDGVVRASSSCELVFPVE
ncbi:hypothetical protein AALP_AA5G156600 [Arabis alpina]|uniref:F-box domain-containing protein n=1 Tax=Arabis alpina TaxID=50452 RepID=A0A087GXB8_ARAAL|nr:hypothetical protein AALP_AA5G156600 [Arabis alpina]